MPYSQVLMLSNRINFRKFSQFMQNIWVKCKFSWPIIKYQYAVCTHLKKKIENYSTWEGAFYQSEWVKINSSWVILVFSLYVCCC